MATRFKSEPRRRFTEPLPIHRLRFSLALLLVGLPLLVLGALGEGTGFQLLRGFGITLTTVSLLDLVPDGVRWLGERNNRLLFKNFFGGATIDDGIRIVNSGRSISRDHLQHLRPKPMPKEAKGRLPEGVRLWMAEDDIRACSYLSQELAVQGIPITLLSAGDLGADKLQSFSSVAVGLGFNMHTWRLMKASKLFAINWSALSKVDHGAHAQADGDADRPVLTDGFEVDGVVYDRPTGSRDYALVARIVPQGAKGHVHFVAAGRTALGTAVAGSFLASNWADLAKAYEEQGHDIHTDSMVVVISHDCLADRVDADDTGQLVATNAIVFKKAGEDPGQLSE